MRVLGLLAAILMFSAPPLAAQTATAFKTGERDTGMTKQCYYDALGSQYSLTIRSTEICPLTVQVRAPVASPRPNSPPPPPQPRAVTAYKTGEQTTGQTKQCFYQALGSEYVRTIASTQICPFSIPIRL